MESDNRIYSVEYESAGLMYAMHIYGTHKEVLQHSNNLGMSEPKLVEAVISNDLLSRLN